MSDDRGMSTLELAVVATVLAVATAVFGLAFLATVTVAAQSVRDDSRASVGRVDAGLVVSEVVGIRHPSEPRLASIRFQVSTLSSGSVGTDFSGPDVEIKYIDPNQEVFVPKSDYRTSWRFGEGQVLDPGELVEVDVDLEAVLATGLGAGTTFTVEIIYPTGRVAATRATPAELTPVVHMR